MSKGEETMDGKQLYHFCAKRQNNNNSLHYFDGTIRTDVDLSTVEGYDSLKDAIGRGMMPPADSGSELVLLSLTKL